MRLPHRDREDVLRRYSERYHRHGRTPEALGWKGDKQAIRYEALTGHFDIHGKHVLDVGCGFGDLNVFLSEHYGSEYHYSGIDLVPEFIDEARSSVQADNAMFAVAEFLDYEPPSDIDFVIASGIFNHALEGCDSYEYIDAVMGKAFSIATEGIAFDFLSSRVDFEVEPHFHADPSHILDMAYGRTRNLILCNDYMPFEFAVVLFKDDSFSRPELVFNQHVTGLDAR